MSFFNSHRTAQGTQKRKRLTAILLTMAMFGLSGCVIYLDDPPERKISGQVVRDDNGAPIANASVWFLSGRKPFSLLPVDTFGVDAAARTDNEGRMALTAKLNEKVRVVIQNDEFLQQFDLPPFPEANQVKDVVWRLKEKKPSQARAPTRPERGSP